MYASTITAAAQIEAPVRTFEIEEVPNPGHDQYRWRLRMYGHGAGKVARGVPCYFAERARADEVAALWVETGK